MALAGRLRAIVEDMAEMPAAATAMLFRPHHQQRRVLLELHVSFDLLPKTWPAGAGVELLIRFENGKVATGASESPLAMLLEERTRAGIFRALLAQHVELLGGQDRLPFLVCFRHFKDFRRAFAPRAPDAVAHAPGRENDGRSREHELALGDHGQIPIVSSPAPPGFRPGKCNDYGRRGPRVLRHAASLRGEMPGRPVPPHRDAEAPRYEAISTSC